MLVQGIEQYLSLAQEDAGIPQHVALQDKKLGLVSRRFFDEAGNLVTAVWLGLSLLDIAVSCTRETRHHAKGDDGALPGSGHTLFNHGSKTLCVGNVVVGWAKQQQLLCRNGQCRQCHSSGCVAPSLLQNDRTIDLCCLHGFSHQKTVVISSHAHDLPAFLAAQLRHPLQRELQQAFVV